MSFNTEAEYVDYYIIVPGINPLNRKTGSAPASRNYNEGACFTNGDEGIDKEIPKLTGAYLDPSRGTLKANFRRTAENQPKDGR